MWSEQISGGLARERARDLQAAAHGPRRGRLARLRARVARRNGVAGVQEAAPVIDGVTIRRSRAADREALQRLAQLDSRRLAGGELLVAEVDGELRAALPLEGGQPIADPFRPTAPLVSLLGLRAGQIRDADTAVATATAPRLYVPRSWSAR
jgi:hypothetical protein